MTMGFCMAPGFCSTGIHILPEETGPIFEARVADTRLSPGMDGSAVTAFLSCPAFLPRIQDITE